MHCKAREDSNNYFFIDFEDDIKSCRVSSITVGVYNANNRPKCYASPTRFDVKIQEHSSQ